MEYCNNRAEASRREVSIKALSRAKKLELILLANIAGHGYEINLDAT
jgi:predicted GIY-YIG superfamily endonuclease